MLRICHEVDHCDVYMNLREDKITEAVKVHIICN